MATAYGLTSQGWNGKPTSVIHSEVDTGLQKILGASAGTEPDGTIPLSGMAGQLKVLIVDGFASNWQLLEMLQASIDPSQADDDAQDRVCAISGVQRHPAEFSTSTVACTGVPGTPLAPARRLTTNDASATPFDSQPALLAADPNYPSSTIAAVAAWAQSTNYALGARVTANGNVYQCTVAGVSLGSGAGPAGTSLTTPIADGGATWRFLGAGTGAVDVVFIAETAGPLGAAAYLLTTIATPVNGWNGAANPIAAIPGALQETNSALRVRRDAEVTLSGNGTADAVGAKLLAVNQGSTDPNHQPPSAVKVLFNDTDVTNANGLPPHSVEAIVSGGTDADIALAIWQAVGVGTDTYGNISSTIIDEEGNPQAVRWTRPIPKSIYVVGTVYYDASKWPATGAPALVVQAALSALLTFGASFPVGTSVRSSRLAAAVIEEPSALDTSGLAIAPAPAGSIAAPGILDVAPLNIGLSPAPGSSAPVSIGVRERATFDAVFTTFTAVAETP